MWYNVRVKTYPDGHKQYLWSENAILRDIPDEDKKKRKKKFVASDKKSTGRNRWNMGQSVQRVYDIARSNEFDWFITLTFDQKKVNRYDYGSCADAVKLFTDRLRKYGCKWLIIPEQHKDGAYHFHGLVAGNLPLTESGKTCYNEAAQQELLIYNLVNFEFGFTTATRIVTPERTASYIAKYLTKKIAVPKGKKAYWASRSLAVPTVDYISTFRDLAIFDVETGELRYVRDHDPDWTFGCPSGVRYVKEIENRYGRYVLSEE